LFFHAIASSFQPLLSKFFLLTTFINPVVFASDTLINVNPANYLLRELVTLMWP
jgi:hypothetical protein